MKNFVLLFTISFVLVIIDILFFDKGSLIHERIYSFSLGIYLSAVIIVLRKILKNLNAD